MKTQIRYQKEIEKLEKINRELKKQLLLRGNDIHAKKKIKVKKSNPIYCRMKWTIMPFSRNPSSTCTLRCLTSSPDTTRPITRPITYQGNGKDNFL